MSKRKSSPRPESGNDGEMTRRTFVKMGLGAVGAGYACLLGYPIYAYLATPAYRAAQAGSVSEVSLPGAEKLPKNAALMFRFGSFPGILIHHEDDTWSAFDAVCTHLGCTVQYEPARHRIFCACHGGVYNPDTGANVSGPPPRPLKRFQVKIEPAAITVSRA